MPGYDVMGVMEIDTDLGVPPGHQAQKHNEYPTDL